jgi:hypothetical protein
MPADKVVKVKPYPIDIQFLRGEGQPVWSGRIVKLTERGFLVEMASELFIKVGDELQCIFSFPTLGGSVQGPVKVVKTYSPQAKTRLSLEKFRLIEMHFKKLASADRTRIQIFLEKIRQK